VEQLYELLQRWCVCGQALELIGHEIREQLGNDPGDVIVHKHGKYRCVCGVATVPKSKTPLPGSQASPQLIAQIMSAKYDEGVPLYRQEKMAKRDGLDLPRAELARWVIQGSPVLQPVWNRLEETLFGYDITAADELGVQVLKETGRSPIIKAGCGYAEETF